MISSVKKFQNLNIVNFCEILVNDISAQTEVKEQDVEYALDKSRADKSCTPIALQYANINNIPQGQFVFSNNEIYNLGLNDDNLYVILDDAAISGIAFVEKFYKNNSILSFRVLLCS